MHRLPVAARAHAAHDDLLGRHERQLVVDAATDARRMDLEALGDVGQQHDDRIGGEERFGNGEAAVRGVVERALEELHGVRLVRVRLQRLREAGECVDALRAHRVALVRHRRRPDLLRLERLLDLAERLQDAHVRRELRRARCDAAHHPQHLRVELARVRLPGDRKRARELHLRRHTAVQLAHLLVITIEQREERRLRPGSSLHAAKR